MYRLIIADDELRIIRGLEKILDWKALQIEIVGTANNGEKAFEMLMALKPDILISDINMPKMNGIDLLKKIREMGLKTKVIFVSGYQEFDYAKSAIKYGAADYLLKPVSEKQLALAVIEAIKDKQVLTAVEKNQILTQLNILEKDHSGISEYTLKSKDDFVVDPQLYYGVLRCDLAWDLIRNKDEKEILRFTTHNIIEKILEPVQGKWFINKEDRGYILLSSDNEQELSRTMQAIGKEVIHEGRSLIEYPIYVTSSDIVQGINKMIELFDMSNHAMSQKFFYSGLHIIKYVKNHHIKYTVDDLYNAQVYISDQIMELKKTTIYDSVKFYLSTVKDVTVWDVDSTKNYCLAADVFIRKNIESKMMTTVDHNNDSVRELVELTKTYEDLVSLMVELFTGYMDQIQTFVNQRDKPELETVKAYILEHFSDKISLDDLANLIHMNPNYFSTYFKKHTGHGVKEYITNLRLEEAKKILLSTDYKIYEVAEMVGFGDYRHFSEVFKRIYGSNPKEYKERYKKNLA